MSIWGIKQKITGGSADVVDGQLGAGLVSTVADVDSVIDVAAHQ